MKDVELGAVPNLRPPPLREVPSFDDPDFLRASAWLARAPEEPAALVLGAPFAGGSISRARCDLTPAALREALGRFSVWNSDRAVSVETLAVLDAGDVEVPEDSVLGAQARIEETVRALRAQADVPIVLLGGDNSVTVGGARGADADALLTFDAHHDCRDPAVRPSNGSPVRQLVEGGLSRVVQVGIHGFANAEPHARWALDHKIHVFTSDRVRSDGMGKVLQGALRLLGPTGRIWVDFDLDVLDRAFAPGAPAAMPGGLWPADLEEAAFVLGREPRVAGIDLTEVDPEADVGGATVRAACAVMLGYLAGVAARAS